MILGLVASLAAGLLYGIAAVGQAAASRRLPSVADGLGNLARTAVRDPLLMGMAASYLVGAYLHLVAIENAPLYIAQVGIAAALPVTAVTSALVLHEPLKRVDWAAVVATFAGIAVLASDAGTSGDSERTTGFVLGLVVALALLVVVGTIAFRSSGRVSAVALSLVAGCCYTTTTLAARVLGSPDASWKTVVLLLVVGVSGVSGFALYSFAMQRLSVAAASAPLILAETLVPSLIGILVLGDGVPAAGLVVLGLVLALGGAVYLAGFEGRVLEGSDARAVG